MTLREFFDEFAEEKDWDHDRQIEVLLSFFDEHSDQAEAFLMHLTGAGGGPALVESSPAGKVDLSGVIQPTGVPRPKGALGSDEDWLKKSRRR